MSQHPPDEGRVTRAKWTLVGITVALTVAVVVYRLTHRVGLSQTGAFFVGLPAILAITVALTPKAKTIKGTTFKAVTFGLLLSGVLVGEGFVCIVMASPLFYLVSLPIAGAIQRRREREGGTGRVYALVLVPVAILSLEGVFDATTLPVRNRVAATEVVPAAAAAVEAALASTPVFDEPLPAFFRQARFPAPVSALGSGLDVGASREVIFSSPMGPAVMALRVAERSPRRVVFAVENDATPIAGWMTLRRAVVTWSERAPAATLVRWEMEFDRELSPAFYFAPLERYAARLAAGYLIRTAATPHG
jgi:hypothetical protein